MTTTSCTLVDSARLRYGLTVVSRYRGRGIPASAIPVGSLLANDVDAADPAGTLYQFELTKPTVGKTVIYEDSSFEFTGAPDGTYTGPETVRKNGAVAYDTTYSFIIGTATTPPSDTTPPTVTAATVSSSAPGVVVLTVTEPLDTDFVPAPVAYAVGGHTVIGVTLAGSAVNLAVTPDFVAGETRAVAYTQPASNGVRDAAGNLVDSFTGLAIANNVAAPVSTISGVTVSPATVTIASGGVQQFTATATGVNPLQEFTWTRFPALGILTTSGQFTAPEVTEPTSIDITATSAQDPNYAGTATVLVAPVEAELDFTRSKTRTIKIKAAPLTFEGSAFWKLTDPRKPFGSIDKDATIDISFDWTEVLADIADTIAQVDFNLVGLVSKGGFSADGIATVFVSTPTSKPSITCHITTNSNPARIEERTVFLTIEDQ